jgi:hypothetical protein
MEILQKITLKGEVIYVVSSINELEISGASCGSCQRGLTIEIEPNGRTYFVCYRCRYRYEVRQKYDNHCNNKTCQHPITELCEPADDFLNDGMYKCPKCLSEWRTKFYDRKNYKLV